VEIGAVAPAQKVNPGAFVQLNANNSMKSAPANAAIPDIPAKRDFEIGAPTPDPNNPGQFLSDPDLMKVTWTITPAIAGNLGFFLLGVDNNKGDGRIRLWTDQIKTKELKANAAYLKADLPNTFYVEGMVPSTQPPPDANNNEQPIAPLNISVSYVSADFLRGNVAIAADTVSATVTPVVQTLNVVTNGANGVVFLKAPLVGVNLSLTTEGPNKNPYGALFDAQARANASNFLWLLMAT
jgi:hypothetical protein